MLSYVVAEINYLFYLWLENIMIMMLKVFVLLKIKKAWYLF